MPQTPTWFYNSAAREWRTAPMQDSPREVHRTFPAYAPTRLVEVPALAAQLGVDNVFVKDESQRLGLPAFKILGASYAIARELSQRLGADQVLSIDVLRDRLAVVAPYRLYAATDGNHGRAVAHMARLLGLAASVYVPPDIAIEAKHAIVHEGATLVDPGLSYDDVVALAARDAAADPNGVLIQDTSWAGYEAVPQWIVDGYSTLLQEVDEQLSDDALDLFVTGAGVGSLAQAVVHHYRSGERTPAVLLVEPVAAPAVTAALTAGEPVQVETQDTVMSGLNCGIVSELAWPILRSGTDASVLVNDDEVIAAVRELAALGVDAGPCGAAALAAARAVLLDPGRRDALGISEHSNVVLLSTEGTAANPKGLS